MVRYFKLVLAIIFCEAVALTGVFFTIPSLSNWYISLNKPFFTPPNYLFGPVWTVLYVLMGIALFLIWEIKPAKQRKNLLVLFALQLALNLFWSIIFFGLHMPLAAFAEIVALWIVILGLIIQSWKKYQAVSLLLFPYILWVSFALILNLYIAVFN